MVQISSSQPQTMRRGRVGRRSIQRAIAPLLLILAIYVQESNAQYPPCSTPDYISDGDPCAIAFAVQEEHCGGSYALPAEGSYDSSYPGLNAFNANRCSCSHVVYNLIQACGFCQGQDTAVPLSEWRNIVCGEYDTVPLDLTEDPQIPSWAHEPYPQIENSDVVIDGADTPVDISSTGTQSINNSGIPTFSFDDANSPRVSASTNNSSGKSSPPIGAIVGGVIGGLAALCAIIFLIFFLARRRKRQRLAPSAEFMKYAQERHASLPLTMDDDANNAIRSRGASLDAERAAAVYGSSSTSAPRHDDDDLPPPFTQGMFNDPIFEKGVALSLATNRTMVLGAGGSQPQPQHQGSIPAPGYSPATPSTTLSHGTGTENQQLLGQIKE